MKWFYAKSLPTGQRLVLGREGEQFCLRTIDGRSHSEKRFTWSGVTSDGASMMAWLEVEARWQLKLLKKWRDEK